MPITIFRLQQAAAIRQQACELAFANRAKDEVLAILGHELHTLAPIVTALDILIQRDGGSSPPEVLMIKRQAEHAVRVVDDLLDVSHLTNGQLELALAPVEIATVVALAIGMVGPLVEQRQHRLVVDVPITGLLVNGDENRLRQLLANLLTNAACYTDPGGQVQIVGRRSDHEIVIDVLDSGTGIAPELVPRLLEMFVHGSRFPAKPHRLAARLSTDIEHVANLLNERVGSERLLENVYAGVKHVVSCERGIEVTRDAK